MENLKTAGGLVWDRVRSTPPMYVVSMILIALLILVINGIIRSKAETEARIEAINWVLSYELTDKSFRSTPTHWVQACRQAVVDGGLDDVLLTIDTAGSQYVITCFEWVQKEQELARLRASKY